MRVIVQYTLTKILMTLMVVLVITGCSPSSGSAPKGAQDAAFMYIKNNCIGPGVSECADFSIVFANKEETSEADKRNGVSERYEINVSYSSKGTGFFGGNPGEWFNRNRCVKMINKGGTWTATNSYGTVYNKDSKNCIYH